MGCPKPSYRPNIYWGHGLAPVECQLDIYCGTLTPQGFRRFVTRLQKEGIYYRHDDAKRTVVVAFETKAARDAHEIMLKLAAFADNKLHP